MTGGVILILFVIILFLKNKLNRLQWIPRGENGEHCECKVSGAIPTVGSNSHFWAVEVLLVVMRLEMATSCPSLFNVPQSFT